MVLQEASADFEQASFPPAAAIDGNPTTGWAIAPEVGKAHVAVFEVQGAPQATSAIVSFQIVQRHGQSHTLGHFRISATSSPPPVRANQGLPKKIMEILALDAASRSPEQQQALAAHYRTIAPLLEPARQQLAAAEKAKAEYIKTVPTTLVATAVEPRTMRVLPRGNWLSDDGEVVSPEVPAFLPPLKAAGSRPTRLDLARWLVSPENPLVARVAVNRLWKIVFGQGIVKSLDDFGSQGAAPTHPELLDWLACEFVDSGWDVKHMLKLMVMSSTYRQSSESSESLRQLDPHNAGWRGKAGIAWTPKWCATTRWRSAACCRRSIGGPSVKPYQPPGYWSHLNFPVREYESDHGEAQYRRGLYTYWARTYLHPSLLAFDAPTREECTVERSRSNTPLQALVLLNDPTYVEAARAFAYRAIVQGGAGIEARLRWAYRQALSRDPDSRELGVLAGLLEKHRAEYAADPAAAAKLLSIGESKLPEGVDPVELAAWTSVVRVLLNLHETITRI